MSERAGERDERGLGKVLSEDSGDLEPTTAGEALRRLIYVTPASEDDRDRIDSVIRFLYDLRSELHSRLRSPGDRGGEKLYAGAMFVCVDPECNADTGGILEDGEQVDTCQACLSPLVVHYQEPDLRAASTDAPTEELDSRHLAALDRAIAMCEGEALSAENDDRMELMAIRAKLLSELLGVLEGRADAAPDRGGEEIGKPFDIHVYPPGNPGDPPHPDTAIARILVNDGREWEAEGATELEAIVNALRRADAAHEGEDDGDDDE